MNEEYLNSSKYSEGIKPTLLGSKPQKNRWLKINFYNKAPMFIRAFLYFLYRYIILLGFLDGIPGLTFHFLQGFWYRFLIDCLIYEKKNKKIISPFFLDINTQEKRYLKNQFEKFLLLENLY